MATNRNKFIQKLEGEVYIGSLQIITMNGITIASIKFVDVVQDEEDKDIIYLVIDSTDKEMVSINYKAIKFIRQYDDCLEITVG